MYQLSFPDKTEHQFFSGLTASRDDAPAAVKCHPNMIAVKCECANGNCDGARFLGDTCMVYHSGRGGTSQV